MRKGQLVTQDQIDKTNLSKHLKLISKFKWELCEPYLDAEIENGSGGRELKHLTFREYKSKVLSNVTQEQMRNNGISKHILQFMSNFLQGKYQLSKADFEAEYLAGSDLPQIAKKHSITRADIGFLRQLYGIKRTGFEYQNRKKTEVLMTQRQKELCYGSMMGDAKRQSTKFNSSMGFGHGDEQKDYLFWKFCELDTIVSKPSFKGTPYKDKRSGFEGIAWRFYTKANSDIEVILNEFYKSDTKEITQNILDNLSVFSIAVWYMDDGKVDWKYRHRILEPTWNIMPIPEFCTECFSHKSCLLMQQWFKDKWNISVRLKEKQLKDRMGYRLIVENEFVEAFFDLIRPHIIPSMLYKIDYEEYCRKRSKKAYELV